VIASAVGALTELVDDGTTGLLVRSDDPSDWAAAVGRLRDDGESIRLGAAAHAAWRAEFSSESALERLETAYASVASRAGYRPVEDDAE
jgi:D-inositol-3-phosphate glycosyltransferase